MYVTLLLDKRYLSSALLNENSKIIAYVII